MMFGAPFLPGLTGGPMLRRQTPSHTLAALSMRTPLDVTPARAWDEGIMAGSDAWDAAQRQLHFLVTLPGTTSGEVRVDKTVTERATMLLEEQMGQTAETSEVVPQPFGLSLPFELTLPPTPPAAEMVEAASSAVASFFPWEEEKRIAREEEEERRQEEEGLLGWRLALLLVTASWGANFPTTKLALDSLGGGAEAASLFIAARFMLSATVLAPAALNASSVGAVKAGAAVGGLCAFGYVAQAAALGLGSQPATCAFICSLQAVVVALITAFRGGGLAPKTAVAVGLAISGIGFLELPEVLAGGLDALCLGDLIALGQPLGFGTSYVVIDQVPVALSPPPPLSPPLPPPPPAPLPRPLRLRLSQLQLHPPTRPLSRR